MGEEALRKIVFSPSDKIRYNIEKMVSLIHKASRLPAMLSQAAVVYV